MLLLDTQALIWLISLDRRLGTQARWQIDFAFWSGALCVSAFTFWEVAMLRTKGRIDFPEDVAAWRLELLDQGLIEIRVDGEIGIRANLLQDFHADPADRIIVATALNVHALVTADERILEWPGELNRLDATR